MANFVAVEARPSFAEDTLGKRNNAGWINKVDKCIAYVALVLEIHAQVYEIVCAVVGLVDHIN
jgi:hypothetical protein